MGNGWQRPTVPVGCERFFRHAVKRSRLLRPRGCPDPRRHPRHRESRHAPRRVARSPSPWLTIIEGSALASGAVVARAPRSEKTNMPGHTETLENNALVLAGFDRWRAGTGSPFE